MFGPKRDEVDGGYIKVHNEEFHNLHSSPCIIRTIKSRSMRLARYVARMENNTNAYRLLVGKPEGKRPVRRSRCKWVDNIKMDFGEIGWRA
jgi:hypothetical protein